MLTLLVTRRHVIPVLLLALLIGGGGSLLSSPPATRAASGGLQIVAVDGAGHRVKGACYGALLGDYMEKTCDAKTSNGLNGVARIQLVAGLYTLKMIRVPPGYRLPDTKQVQVVAGTLTVVTIVMATGANTLRIRTTTFDGDLVPGGCYMATWAQGSSYQACDGDDGTADGIIRFGGMRRGTTYEVIQLKPPTGYVDNMDHRFVTFPGVGAIKTQTWLALMP